jgi:hypothetical protein
MRLLAGHLVAINGYKFDIERAIIQSVASARRSRDGAILFTVVGWKFHSPILSFAKVCCDYNLYTSNTKCT